jgi:hypothetical protein
MSLDNVIWLMIGFLPTYGAMELAWRMAKRMATSKNKTTVTEGETIITSVPSKTAK